jgi:hypothetical protein
MASKTPRTPKRKKITRAQLNANAEVIGRLGKEVEALIMGGYDNDAHPSWHALALAWRALLMADSLCLAGGAEPGQLESIRTELRNLERRLEHRRRPPTVGQG